MNARKEDPKLQEVKDVLRRLQRMDVQEDIPGAPEAAVDAARPFPTGIKSLVIVSGIAGVLCVAAVVAATHMANDDRPPPSLGAANGSEQVASPRPIETAAESAPPASTRVDLAQKFMLAGRVKAARELLLEESEGRSEDVALALARSYDPNLLKQVPGADSEPDRAEAERWYREWHAIAKEKGLVTDGVALERLIRSMR